MSNMNSAAGVTRCNQKAESAANDNNCNGYRLQAKIENLKESEVKEIYLKMRAAGITPTARLLRDELKHGSFTTLQKMLSKLNKTYAQNGIADIKNKRIPDGVMNLLIEELSKRALKCTIESDDKKIEELEQMIIRLTTEHSKIDEDFACQLDMALKKQSELEMTLSEKEKLASKLQAENTDLRNQLTALSSQLEINRSRYASLDEFFNFIKAVHNDPSILEVLKGKMEA